MPRFVRGGRGLWRKAQSSSGLFPQSNEVKGNGEKLPPIPTPRLNLVFKIITIIAIIFFIISLVVMMNADESNDAYIAWGIIGGICLYTLLLEFPTYMLVYRMITINYYKHEEVNHNRTNQQGGNK